MAFFCVLRYRKIRQISAQENGGAAQENFAFHQSKWYTRAIKKQHTTGMEMKKICTILAMMALLLLTSTFVPDDSQARVGGGRSFGSRSSRSYSSPSRPASAPSPSRQQTAAPQTTPSPAPTGGGFFRSLAGGVAGGLLGGMLFSALGGGGWGSGGGSGLLGILLMAGLGYLIFRLLQNRNKKRQEQPQQDGFQPSDYAQEHNSVQRYSGETDLAAGLASLGQTDPAFDEKRFNEQAMDIFFKIQGAWMHRDLTPIAGILTEEMRKIIQEDVDRLLRDKQINRLENIAVRTVEITEAWQEPGQDYITARIHANLLDYTVSDTNDHISGSTTEPVKFEEFWTFARPAGNNPWRLSAIHQS